jgi:hypothetical protein
MRSQFEEQTAGKAKPRPFPRSDDVMKYSSSQNTCFMRCGLMMLAATILGANRLLAQGTELQLGSYNNFDVIVHYLDQSSTQVAEQLRASALEARFQTGAPVPLGVSSFVAFSLGIPERLPHSGLWQFQQAGNLEDVATRLSNPPLQNSEGLLRAASLYQAYSAEVAYGNGKWTGKEEGAALQLAIWDVLYGNSQTVDDPHSTFYISGTDRTLVMLANRMLASAANRADPTVEVGFWDEVQSGQSSNRHDLFTSAEVLIGPSFLLAVPEPGTCVAGGMALFYLAGMSVFLRKKTN